MEAESSKLSLTARWAGRCSRLGINPHRSAPPFAPPCIVPRPSGRVPPRAVRSTGARDSLSRVFPPEDHPAVGRRFGGKSHGLEDHSVEPGPRRSAILPRAATPLSPSQRPPAPRRLVSSCLGGVYSFRAHLRPSAASAATLRLRASVVFAPLAHRRCKNPGQPANPPETQASSPVTTTQTNPAEPNPALRRSVRSTACVSAADTCK
jgi:hypothetical protein